MLGDAEQADLVVKEQILVSKNKTKLKIRQLIKKQSVFQKSQKYDIKFWVELQLGFWFTLVCFGV